MTAEVQDEADRQLQVGQTTLATRALQHLVIGLTRDTIQLPVRAISVALADHSGMLEITVTVPVPLDPGTDRSLLERGGELREHIVGGMQQLAGREVRSVNIRFSGVQEQQRKRVQ